MKPNIRHRGMGSAVCRQGNLGSDGGGALGTGKAVCRWGDFRSDGGRIDEIAMTKGAVRGRGRSGGHGHSRIYLGGQGIVA